MWPEEALPGGPSKGSEFTSQEPRAEAGHWAVGRLEERWQPAPCCALTTEGRWSHPCGLALASASLRQEGEQALSLWDLHSPPRGPRAPGDKSQGSAQEKELEAHRRQEEDKATSSLTPAPLLEKEIGEAGRSEVSPVHPR